MSQCDRVNWQKRNRKSIRKFFGYNKITTNGFTFRLRPNQKLYKKRENSEPNGYLLTPQKGWDQNVRQ